MDERGFFGARPAGVDCSSAGIGAWSETVRRGDVPLVLAARGLRAVAIVTLLAWSRGSGVYAQDRPPFGELANWPQQFEPALGDGAAQSPASFADPASTVRPGLKDRITRIVRGRTQLEGGYSSTLRRTMARNTCSAAACRTCLPIVCRSAAPQALG